MTQNQRTEEKAQFVKAAISEKGRIILDEIYNLCDAGTYPDIIILEKFLDCQPTREEFRKYIEDCGAKWIIPKYFNLFYNGSEHMSVNIDFDREYFDWLLEYLQPDQGVNAAEREKIILALTRHFDIGGNASHRAAFRKVSKIVSEQGLPNDGLTSPSNGPG